MANRNDGLLVLLKEMLSDLKGRVGHVLLPILALFILLGVALVGGGGMEEIEPGEVGVLYNTTGLALFGPDSTVVTTQGTVFYIPWIQRMETLDTSPQILIMEGGDDKEKDPNPNHAKKLTVRANDGSNFFFPKLEIHYQIEPSKANLVIATHGRADAYKQTLLKSLAREVLRNQFGRYTFLEAANPGNYSRATTLSKTELNQRLNPTGLTITQIPPPKPAFDPDVEKAIRDRQTAEQAVQVQETKRGALERKRTRLIQDVKEKKNAELQTLVAGLAAKVQQTQNTLVDTKREADQYAIGRRADGKGNNIVAINKAKAQEDAARERAQGLAAKVKATGDQGDGVLNLTIANHIFEQIASVTASPYYRAAMPLDIRTTNLTPAAAAK